MSSHSTNIQFESILHQVLKMTPFARTQAAGVYWGVYAGIRSIPTSGVFWQRILTSFVIIKQGIQGYMHWRRRLYRRHGKCRGTFWPIREYFFTSFETIESQRQFCQPANIISTDLRCTILVKNLSSLMFVNLNGPPLRMWRPESYVKSWLQFHRSANET